MTFRTRTIHLIDDQRRELAAAAVMNAPIGIEVVLREPVKARKPSQNALMWAGTLTDISAQAWSNGRTYSPEVWHEHFKREFLPEASDPDIDRLVRAPETYHKWADTPGGERVCIGSTTDLTVHGFAQYLEQVCAYAAGLGVMFTVNPREIS